MHHRDWLLASFIAFWATCTVACTEPQDLRPYSQRLAVAPLAFIGTVTTVAGQRVTFAVHHVTCRPAAAPDIEWRTSQNRRDEIEAMSTSSSGTAPAFGAIAVAFILPSRAAA